MNYLKGIVILAAAWAPFAAGQAANGPKIVPSQSVDQLLRELSDRNRTQTTEEVGPSRLVIKPPSDPIYLVDEREWDGEKWHTYRRPKVDPFSKNADSVALNGYDVLAYLERTPQKGDKQFSFEYGGVTWWFASEDHLRTFRAEPARFVPEYGGFCAYSVGKGHASTADPKVFVANRGKLYLFYDPAAKTVWEQEQGASIARAEHYWPKLHR